MMPSVAEPKPKPLQIILTSEQKTTSGGNVTTKNYISLYPGMINNIWPKVGGSFLWQMPPDDSGGFLLYPRQEIMLPVSGASDAEEIYIWLKCRCIAGVVVEAVCESGKQLPTNTKEYGHVQLGFINKKGQLYQLAYGPISYMTVIAFHGESTPSYPFVHHFRSAYQ